MPIKAEKAVALKPAWAMDSILLIRSQKLDGEAQYAFVHNLARLRHIPNRQPRSSMNLISDEVDEDGRRLGSLGYGEMYFHTDKCDE